MGGAHFFNWQNIENVKIIALCDIRPEQISDKGIAKTYTDFYEMLNKEQPDIIDICTPSYLHKEMSVAAMEMGFNVVCEKPAALSSKDISEMLAVAERNNVTFMVAQVLRFWHEYNVLRDIYNHQRYGKLVSANLWRHSGAPFWDWENWMSNQDRSGLVPFDLHIHDLDVIVSLFGKPECFTINTCHGRGKTYAEHLRIDYDFGDKHVNGEAAWFNADSPWTARWRVYFENAVVINDGKTMTAYTFDAPPRVFDTKDEVEISTGINVPPCGWYYNELKHFAQCIREGVPTPYVSREQLLTVMEILEEVSKWT